MVVLSKHNFPVEMIELSKNVLEKNSKTFINVSNVKTFCRKRKSVDLQSDIESRDEFKKLVRSDNPLEVAFELEENNTKKIKMEPLSCSPSKKDGKSLKEYHREMKMMLKKAFQAQFFTKVRNVRKATRRRPVKDVETTTVCCEDPEMFGRENSMLANRFESDHFGSDYLIASSPKGFDELIEMMANLKIAPDPNKVRNAIVGKVNTTLLVAKNIVTKTLNAGITSDDIDAITKSIKRTSLTDDDNADSNEQVSSKRQRREC